MSGVMELFLDIADSQNVGAQVNFKTSFSGPWRILVKMSEP